MALWTTEMRAKQSASKSRFWQAKVRADADAHPLAKARALRDLTQRECAALAGCAAQTISEIENGKQVGTATQEKLARVLCLPPGELFT
jgi:DNA-binding XRE family transcriptional regulator